jgi:hypothetical protein
MGEHGRWEHHTPGNLQVIGVPLLVQYPARFPEPRGSLDQLLYPVEPPLPSNGTIASIQVDYPERAIALLGWETHWMVVFFLLTMVLAFVLRRPLRVQI